MSDIDDILNQHFEDIKSIRPGAYRAVSKKNSVPYAVHYFDESCPLKDPGFNFDSYQYDLLGEDYYQSDGSIQWNYYLNILVDEAVLDDDDCIQKISAIQKDRSLARKSIFTKSELKKYLTKEDIEITEIEVTPISKWSSTLVKNGLEILLHQNMAIDKTVEMIVKGQRSDGVGVASTVNSGEDSIVSIDRLVFSNYRHFPLKRDFEFGNVNLIHGENAVGKTSLLEAIELAICGRTARYPDDEDFEFAIAMNGDQELQTVTRQDNAFYRTRDRNWYGNHYTKNNKLPSSFAHFNYFDSDAALRFSDNVENEGVSSALAGVLFGEETKKLWKRLENVHIALGKKKRKLEKDLNDLNVDIRDLEASIDEVEVVDGPEFEIPRDMLSSAGIRSDSNLTIDELEDLFSRLDVPISTLESQDVFDSLMSLKSIEIFLSREEETIRFLVNWTEQLEEEKQNSDQLKVKVKHMASRKSSFVRLARYVDSDVVTQLTSLNSRITNLDQRLSSIGNIADAFSLIDTSVLKDIDGSEPIDALIQTLSAREIEYSQTASSLSEYVKSLAKENSEYQYRLKALREEALTISTNHKLDECPVCGKAHGNEELLLRVVKGLDLTSELTSSHFINEQARFVDTQSRLEDAQKQIEVLRSIRQLSVMFEMDPGTSYRTLVDELRKTNVEVDEKRESVRDCQNQLENIESAGFSSEELDVLLRLLDLNTETLTRIDKDLYLSDLDAQLEDARRSLEQSESRKAEANQQIKAKLESFTNLGNEIVDLSSYRSNVARAKKIDLALGELKQSLSIDENASVYDAVKVAQDAQRLLIRISNNQEKTFRRNADSANLQRSKDAKVSNTRELENISVPFGLISGIVETQSLDVMMVDFIKLHSKSIESIFLAVHAPREFVSIELTGKELSLKRRDGSSTSIKQLSTGQRTAIALSVFLVMNSVLKHGPNLILFDDPVAYVDDLNVLSFLDFLRDMSMDSKKQIFFATASSKVSSLFTRKFDVFGKGFRSYELERLPADYLGLNISLH